MSRLVHALQQSQRWEETVLVLTADHGEEFLEHGARYHSPKNLPEELIHVPLLLRAPGLSGRRISNAPFSLIHLAPTLLEVLGVPVPNSFQGRSHWGEIVGGSLRAEAAVAEAVGTGDNPLQLEDRMRPRVMAIRDGRYKLVIRFGEKTESLYDLAMDPEEQSPLRDSAAVPERGRLLQLAHAHLQWTKQNRNADFALRSRLRRLQQSVI
jgi:arylsulfatase A-like enzyme